MNIIHFSGKKSDHIISQAVKILKKGGLVIFPSDTVYGALVDAKNKEAVEKLIAFKNRPPGKPISVFVSDFEMLEEYAYLREKRKLLDEILPGPFTVILESKHKVSSLLESEKGTLGLRLIKYSPVIELVRKYSSSITATSANLSGRHPHYSVDSLLKEFPKRRKDLIDLIVDGEKLPRHKPSTIVDLTSEKIKLLRKGDIIFENKETFISENPLQTKKIAGFILEKIKNKLKKKPVVVLLKGDLGSGKTVFVKGVGEALGEKEITSPTFVIYYEYPINGSIVRNLYHFDLYQIEDPEEFKHLGIEKLLKSGNLFCIEWGSKSGEIISLLKNKAEILEVNINADKKEVNKRKIIFKNNNFG